MKSVLILANRRDSGKQGREVRWQAVEEFKDRVPDLARGLADKIKVAHRNNPQLSLSVAYP